MPVSEQTLEAARRLSRPAVEAVLADSYPAVCRMARALTGREGAARQLTAAILKRGLHVLPTWRAGAIPENWFYHHTVIAARMAPGEMPSLKDDLLVLADEQPANEYLAFVAALRKLPSQQREAFILHHGERLNERLLGVAMDCSAGAAAAHLAAATQALDAVTGKQCAALSARLSRAYARLGPTQQAVLPMVRRRVRQTLWRRRVRRAIRAAAAIAIVAALAYAAWHWRAQLSELASRKSK
jgi:DNA-directed RNA polymerase specialized sigma24 family protein